MSTFLDRAIALHTQGYRVIPIKPNTKRPVIDGWEKLNSTRAQIEGWARNGYMKGSIGILTADTPAVDIDVYDEEIASEMEAWMLRTFGDDLLVRVGMAPKRLLMFRARTPFKKMVCTYKDAKGKEHRIEVLGDGQQFVAYGVHPDTQREYEWTSLDEPMFIAAKTLPEITEADVGLIFDKFEALAKAAGWSRVNRTGEMRGSGDGDDAFGNYKRPLAMTLEEVRDTLDYVPNKDADYDRWLDIGFALHHQFGGGSEGLQLWHDWSAASSKYDAADLNRRWESMGEGPATKTFATVKMWAKEGQKHEAKQEWAKQINRINLAPDTEVLFGDILPSLARMQLDDVEVDQALSTIRNRVKELTGTAPRLASINKRFIAAKPKRELTARDAPSWVRDWIYVLRTSEFYNLGDGLCIGHKSFDARYGRELLTEEDRAAGNAFAGKASDTALNLYQIRTVFDKVYLPGEGELVDINGREFVNIFNTKSVPVERTPTTADDFTAITLVERHFEVLFPDARERNLLLDFLAFNVQFPAEKITWAVLIQGVDGAGKSWMAELMSACIGGPNVSSVPGEALKEKYTSWATGKKMVFLEEVRMHGNNKYEVIDRMKPYITNSSVSIRKMGTDLYESPNVSAYVLFTNHDDALPIDRNDRRYLVLRTRFLTAAQLIKFRSENPNYFENLFGLLAWHGDVLRDWFLKRRISDDFEPKGHAPQTEAKQLMLDTNEAQDDEMEALEEILRESEDPEVSERLLNATKLRQTGQFVMPPKAFGYFMKRAGFAVLGKYRMLGRGSEQTTYYARDAELLDTPESARIEKIRKILHGDALPFDDGFGDET